MSSQVSVVRRAIGLLAFWMVSLAHGSAQSSSLVDILAQELKRNYEGLQKADPKPYYLSYAVTETEGHSLTASGGALHQKSTAKGRVLDVSIRVGDPKLDNYHRIRGQLPDFAGAIPLPIENDAASIQRRAWAETDRVYRLAAQRLMTIQTNSQVRLAGEDKSGDFSEAEAVVQQDAPRSFRFSTEEWASRLRKLSTEFHQYNSVINSGISITSGTETRILVSTEGTRLTHGRSSSRVTIWARGKAFDGMDLTTSATFDSVDPSRLPGQDALKESVHKVAKDLTALVRAPLVEPYVGPAILSGRSAAVFFHEIFGHRVEGHRQKDESEGQTFTKSLNSAVLPDFLSVTFDPTRRNFGSEDLNGHYAFDDEGVEGKPVTVVENGILKGFLLSRSPIEGFAKSNGHGRKQAGHEVVARQSNLIVESKKQVSDARLREQLIEEIKRQNKPYGLFFREVTGGYTFTGRRGLQAFTVMPVLVYLVYPDGKPDQLVRGADIVGTPLASFSKILATSDKPEVFNGICGAESGSVPVSAISPAILVSEIEIQKKAASDERPPILSRPQAETESR